MLEFDHFCDIPPLSGLFDVETYDGFVPGYQFISIFEDHFQVFRISLVTIGH